MTFSEWLATVEATMHDHPDWLKDTQLVIMAGLQRRLAEEAELRTRAEHERTRLMEQELQEADNG